MQINITIAASAQIFSVEKFLHSKPLVFSRYSAFLTFTFCAWTGEGRAAACAIWWGVGHACSAMPTGKKGSPENQHLPLSSFPCQYIYLCSGTQSWKPQ